MAPTGILTTLFNFSTLGTNAYGPAASLLLSVDGNLYGTTVGGGIYTPQQNGGCGTVFQMTPGGSINILAYFNGANGANPCAGLAQVRQPECRNRHFATEYLCFAGVCTCDFVNGV
jgi:uncharacterized repeat protein (TIGR03803 family)